MLPPPTTMPTWTPIAWSGRDLLRDERAEGGVHAVLALAQEGLAGELEQDPAVPEPAFGGGRRRPLARAGLATGVRHISSPSA